MSESFTHDCGCIETWYNVSSFGHAIKRMYPCNKHMLEKLEIRKENLIDKLEKIDEHLRLLK